jgi:hypothetical protein
MVSYWPRAADLGDTAKSSAYLGYTGLVRMTLSSFTLGISAFLCSLGPRSSES